MRAAVIGRSSQWHPVAHQRLQPEHAQGAFARYTGESIASYLARARSEGLNNVFLNAQINRDYLTYGKQIQQRLAPDFKFNREVRQCIPNWFPIAFHVSNTVGDSMAGALAGLELLEELRTRRLVAPDILKRLGARSEDLSRLSRMWFELMDIPHDVGTLLFAALRMNYGALWKPHHLFMSIRRLRALLDLASGMTNHEKTESILRNTVQMLGAGNQAVYADIGPAFEAFLLWQSENIGAPGRVMIDSIDFDASKKLAQSLFDLAASAAEIPYPIRRFAESAPFHEGRALLLASAALYQEASLKKDDSAKRESVRSANALLALREQRDLLQPAFDNEQSGQAIFQALTPMLRVHFGRVIWNYTRFEVNPLLGNWGLFEDRWPAIMDAFERLYVDPGSAWDVPSHYTAVLTNA